MERRRDPSSADQRRIGREIPSRTAEVMHAHRRGQRSRTAGTKTAHVTRNPFSAKFVARIGVEPHRGIRRIGMAARLNGGREAPIPSKAEFRSGLDAVIEPADAAHRHVAVFVGQIVEETGRSDFVPRRGKIPRHPQIERTARADESQRQGNHDLCGPVSLLSAPPSGAWGPSGSERRVGAGSLAKT